MKALDRNEANRIVDKRQEKNGNLMRRFWDLGDQLQELDEALKRSRIIKVRCVLNKVQDTRDRLYLELRAKGALGPYLHYPDYPHRTTMLTKNPVFIDPKIIIRKHKVAW